MNNRFSTRAGKARACFCLLVLSGLLLLASACGGEASPRYELTYAPDGGEAVSVRTDSAEELIRFARGVTDGTGGQKQKQEQGQGQGQGLALFPDFQCAESNGLFYRSSSASFSGQTAFRSGVLTISFPYAVTRTAGGEADGRIWIVRLPLESGETAAASSEETSTPFLFAAAGVLCLGFGTFFVLLKRRRRED